MTTSTASEFVILRGGSAVEVAALKLLWRLEDRGLDIRLDDDGRLLVGPRDALTPRDRAGIREHRDSLVELVRYCDEVIG